MKTDEEMDAPTPWGPLRVSPALLTRVAALDEFKGAWQALGRLAPDRLTSLQQVATIESIGSSTRIEGARLSDAEVEQLLAGIGIRPFKTRDEQEVAGYAAAMKTVMDHWREIELTENHIRQLHRDLLQYSTKDERHRGSYKTLPNHVEALGPGGESLGVVFETATPFATPARVKELVDWARTALLSRDIHPLLVIGVFIVIFLAIHPFQDGNGRLSRVLSTLLLLRAGYAYVPFSSLESVIEASKSDYYLALRRTQAGLGRGATEWIPWLDYYLGALQQQQARLKAKVDHERVLLAALPELSLRILELGRQRGRVTVAEVVRLTGASRNTVKGHFARLVRDGHLRREGAGRGTWYQLAV